MELWRRFLLFEAFVVAGGSSRSGERGGDIGVVLRSGSSATPSEEFMLHMAIILRRDAGFFMSVVSQVCARANLLVSGICVVINDAGNEASKYLQVETNEQHDTKIGQGSWGPPLPRSFAPDLWLCFPALVWSLEAKCSRLVTELASKAILVSAQAKNKGHYCSRDMRQQLEPGVKIQLAWRLFVLASGHLSTMFVAT
jgi:hypothetical protein